MEETYYLQMNYGLLLYLKLTTVVVVNVSEKGKNMEGIIAWSIFAGWFFNQTLSMYAAGFPYEKCDYVTLQHRLIIISSHVLIIFLIHELP